MLRRVTFVIIDVPPKRRLLQKPHGVTSQETAFFIDIRERLKSYTLKICSSPFTGTYIENWTKISKLIPALVKIGQG
jgi:hypothetical protein